MRYKIRKPLEVGHIPGYRDSIFIQPRPVQLEAFQLKDVVPPMSYADYIIKRVKNLSLSEVQIMCDLGTEAEIVQVLMTDRLTYDKVVSACAMEWRKIAEAWSII